MRFSEDYNALLDKINVQKKKYAEKEMAYSNEIDYLIIHHTEKKQKYSQRMIVYIVIALLFIGFVYDIALYINEKWLIWLYIGLILAIFIAMTTLEIIQIFKIKKLKGQKTTEEQEKNTIREHIIALNNQISSLVVSTITINEHYYELSSIENEEELIQKWNIYTYEVIEAINKKYDYHATYTEYQEFYREYVLTLESLNSNE